MHHQDYYDIIALQSYFIDKSALKNHEIDRKTDYGH